jgi:4-amino-4-deoxy-L-arabinose transferase-like glycosyltransferase
LEGRLFFALAGIAAIGLALRIWYLLAVAGKAPLVGDGLEFHALANGLADGHGYVSPIVVPGQEAVATAHKPPLYPLSLAVVSAFGGTGYVAHQIASAVMGTGTVLVLGMLGARLAGRRAALLAAGLGALYPVFVATDASLRSDSLYTLLIALALLSAYRAWERPSPARLGQLGVVIALAALTRSEGLVLLVLLAAPIVWRRGEGRWARLAVVAVACGLVLAPWLIRCWVVFDQPVAISTNSGDLLAGANCSATYSGPLLGSWAFDCVLGARGENEAVIADRLRARGLRYARDRAERLPAVVAVRSLRTWGLYKPASEIRLHAVGEGRDETASWIGLAALWCLIPLGAWGLVVLRRRGQPLFILLAPLVLVVMVSAGAYGILRFRAPADVALIVLASVALDALLSRRKPHRPLSRG